MRLAKRPWRAADSQMRRPYAWPPAIGHKRSFIAVNVSYRQGSIGVELRPA
jgi:hypothetical protein